VINLYCVDLIVYIGRIMRGEQLYMAREIIILPYNENWTEHYNQIKNQLINIFGDLVIDIQHIGSTSIRGMSAKPIIDVMIIVNDIQEVDNLSYKMIDVGYKARGENGIPGRRYFQYFHEDDVNHTQHIHIYEKNNAAVIDQLMFRDYLRIDKDAFEQYQQAKIDLAELFRHSPSEYTNAKNNCINEILNKAKSHYKTK
jgi:GrpB-like predicted nucleotidyltransferase (UPF0157 family)